MPFIILKNSILNLEKIKSIRLCIDEESSDKSKKYRIFLHANDELKLIEFTTAEKARNAFNKIADCLNLRPKTMFAIFEAIYRRTNYF